MNEINIKPMVDILSELTNRVVVMSGDEYVYLDDKVVVESSFIESGVAKQEEYLALEQLKAWKASRAEAVANLKVTVDGMEFDADEVSQGRMARAIISMTDTDEIIWVLANNTPATLNKAQLSQALRLAGEAQTALWVNV